jgi:hypothetical protein
VSLTFPGHRRVSSVCTPDRGFTCLPLVGAPGAVSGGRDINGVQAQKPTRLPQVVRTAGRFGIALRYGPVVLEDPDLLKAAAFLRDLAFPPCVMQADLIDVPHRFAPVRNGSVDESCLPGDDVE